LEDIEIMNTNKMESMSALVQRFQQGEIGADDYLSAIEARFQQHEPIIWSFVPEPRRFERLKRDLLHLMNAHPNNKKPPLFGVPVGVKDIFHVKGLPTRAASSVPSDVLVSSSGCDESVAVTQLKAAGALILGKTVTTEFAWFGPGPTRNPHDPHHTPGGSSSGSAAAVAAGLCSISLGSQTIGSVNRPASFCGIVGFKPSYDRISRVGVIELAHSHDHVGVLAETLESAEKAARILCDDWKTNDATTKGKVVTLAIPTGPYLEYADEEMLQHLYGIGDQLDKNEFIDVLRIPVMPDFDEINRLHLQLTAYDAAAYHAQFSDYHHLYHAKTRELIAMGNGISDEDAAKARASKARLKMALQAVMDFHSIDAWMTPSAPGAAPAGHHTTGDPIMNMPFTHAGMPTISLPTGRSAQGNGGLPLGIQFAARDDHDEHLFQVVRVVKTTLQSSAY
jgi:Asp-tRNA(Asn)/Glu-tRNA(Gln) amidotransferase A subunit family amidase